MSRRLKRSFVWSTLILAAVLAGMTGAVSPAAAAKGSLTMAHGGSLRSIDPQLTYGTYEMRALRHIYEPLLDLDASGEKLVPVLAESWRISPDGLTYTFKLRSGVKFANGEPFDAKAVLATIERGKTDKKLGFNFIYSAIAQTSSPDPSTVILKTDKPQASARTTTSPTGRGPSRSRSMSPTTAWSWRRGPTTGSLGCPRSSASPCA